MKKNKILLFVLPLMAFAIAGAFNVKDQKVVTRDSNLIVLVKDHYKSEDALKELRNLVGFNYRVVDTYKGIANGFKINVNKEYLEDIRNFNSVEFATLDQVVATKSATEDKIFPAGEVYLSPKENDSIIDINAKTLKGGEKTLIAVLDSSFNVNHLSFKDLSSDIGVRYEKADIGAIIEKSEFRANTSLEASYINRKLPYVYDYGGTVTQKNSNYSNIEDSDVFSTNSYHGMHVASIAAANGDFLGIAPNAQVAFLKVFGDLTTGGQVALDSFILTALNDAYLLGADTINMSFGSDLHDFNEPTATDFITKKIKETGSILSVSAGNAGKDNWSNSGSYANNTTEMVETGILGSHAVDESSTVVASSMLGVDEGRKTHLSVDGYTLEGYDQIINRGSGENETKFNTQKPFSSLIASGKDRADIPYVVVPGVGKISDYEGIDVKGKIALISRGDTSFSEKIAVASGRGAIGTIICNNKGLGSLAYFDLAEASENSLVPTYSMGVEQGEILKKAQNKVLSIAPFSISDFSDDGATTDLRMKPEITSPGTNIMGAISDPKVDGASVNTQYAYLNGTSMAAPNFAGAVAAILGEKEFSSEEERVAYKKTIMNRVMSSADVLTHANGADVATRRQGAGKVNVNEAISTPLYLLNEGDSKVELKNNADIAKGLIKFEVEIVNEGKIAGTFPTLLTINVPETTTLDSETHPNYNKTPFQTTRESKIGEVKGSVTLNGEARQKVLVSYQVEKNKLDELAKVFTNGHFIEGFYHLNKDNEAFSVNIPFMGFYGDYSKGDAVEAFDFEKDPTKIYQSTLMNSIFTETGIKKPEANFESTIVSTTGGLEAADAEKFFLNDANPTKVYNKVNAEEIDGLWHFYAGGKGVSDTLYIQQFVNRNVLTNQITITKEGTLRPILIDHMFDAIYGGNEDYRLRRTMATTDLIVGSDGYVLATRAYTIIPLYDQDNKLYTPGNYNIKFSYTLVDKSVQEKEYVMVVDDSVPTPTSFSIKNNTLVLEVEGSVFALKSNDLVATKEEIEPNKSRLTLDLSTAKNKDRVFVQLVSTTGGVMNGTINLVDEIVLFGKDVVKDYKVKVSETLLEEALSLSYEYKITLYNSAGIKVAMKNPYVIGFKPNVELGENIEVSLKDGDTLTKIPAILNNGYIMYSGQKIESVISKIVTEKEFDPLFLIIGASAGIVIIVAAVVTTLILVRKKKNEK